jgi:hypothetical protein
MRSAAARRAALRRSRKQKAAWLRQQTDTPNSREAARSQRTASPAHPKPTERNQRT